MLKISLTLSLIFLLCWSKVNAVVPPLHAPKFSANEVVVFVGDSITHGGGYHKDIFLFHATRHPDIPIRYYNAGISGDTAEGTIKRFKHDVALHKPTYVTVMLGMNDVGSWLYSKVPDTQAARNEQKAQQIIVRNRYLNNMQTLADMLSKQGSKITFLTPSIYDETAKLQVFNNIGRNDELGAYANELSILAKQYQASVVDFQQPMLAINKKWQQQDPTRSIVGTDRVHPGEQGHFLMAYQFLKSQGEMSQVSNIHIDVNSGLIKQSENCEITSSLTIQKQSIEFACRALALPFPMTNAQTSMLQDIPFQQEFNQQIFKVSGLEAGEYRLKIGDKVIDTYSHERLLNGIDLSTNTNTPMYQQAMLVKTLNDKRAKASIKIRNIQHVRFTMLSHYPEVNETDTRLVKATLRKHIDKSKDKPWFGYLNSVMDSYLETVNQETTIRRRVDELFEQIYQVNQPKAHKWQLIKL